MARVQTMLRGGRHVADIAMLYPICDLHGKVNLYFSPVNGYEYPALLSKSDYMTVINSSSEFAESSQDTRVENNASAMKINMMIFFVLAICHPPSITMLSVHFSQ